MTTVVALRFIAAKIKKRRLRPDDWMIVISYISTLATEALTSWAVAYGMGAHTWELNTYAVGVQYKVLLGSGITWVVATAFCKISILWFYTCIFSTKGFKLSARILMLFVAAYAIAFFCVFLTNCQPISYQWHPVPGGHCKSITVEEITSVSANMVIDTAIVVLPMRPLWGLQMATRKKIGISILFGLGLLVVAVMGWRIKITVESTTKTDFVYGLGNIGIVTMFELWVGIIVACLPTLAPFYSKYLAPIMSTLYKKSQKHSSSRRLKEAQHTIGSADSPNFRKKNFNRLDDDTLLELEEGGIYGTTAAMVSSSATVKDDFEDWQKKPNSIGVRHDVQVSSVAQEHQPL